MESNINYISFLQEHITLFSSLKNLEEIVKSTGLLMAQVLNASNKILLCGNGGSAADAQHFAAELIGRFEKERSAWPAIALTTDTSILTALGNDYGYDIIFSRQVEGLGENGDLLIGISTSGNSKNIVKAANKAKSKGISTIGLLGRDGGVLANIMDHSIIVPHKVTARIQEAHTFIIHFWAALIENELTM